jgi:hypothetical protein
MRFLKLNGKFNWKYVVGEILLIFIGINLAIWFNNWNTSKKSVYDKQVAIEKIIEEIENNRSELNLARDKNMLILSAFNSYKNLYNGNTSELIASPESLNILQNKFPKFYRVKDSTFYSENVFLYKGDTHIVLEIPSLTEIAWETTRTIGLTSEFEYECLYEFEKMYDLQRRVQNEINKAANALQKRELYELMNILEFISQLDLQLKTKYDQVLEEMDDCS